MSRKNRKTRTEILNAAWRLLEEEGAEAVRMSDIAAAVGISRQALYLHFPSRADLLIAVTRHIDEVKDVDARLVSSRTAASGRARLDAFIEDWGNYIPEVYGVAKALIAIMESDEAARAAWQGRLEAIREGCEAAVKALKADGDLAPGLSPKQATDLLWTLVSVENWEKLRIECGWSQKKYTDTIKQLAREALVAPKRKGIS